MNEQATRVFIDFIRGNQRMMLASILTHYLMIIVKNVAITVFVSFFVTATSR